MLYFYLRIHWSVFNTQTLVSLCHHTINSFTHFTLPFPSGNHQFSVSKCLLLFGLFIDFVVEFAFYNPHREKSKCWLFSHARLWYPMDCGPSGSSVHGVLQAGILEWIAISSSRESSNQGLELRSPALQADSLPFEPAGLCLHDLCD